MRFAISLLVIICIASVVGTVLPQNQPINNYIDQFGPFWAELFDTLALFNVYNAWWFLVIMAFLVVSTGICLIRNAPGMIRDARSFREHIREGSWRAFPHRAQVRFSGPADAAARRVAQWLGQTGFRVRVVPKDQTVLVAARAGGGNRWGYIFAHAAIVIICLGGLLDSNLPIRLQIWFGGKQPIVENMRIAEVPPSGRLSINNPSFRATALLPEGGQTANAVVVVNDGALVQPLPFSLKLKDFSVDYYSTGMPSDFASEVEVTDRETGETFVRTIRVNEPLTYKGVTVYQSSFDDGGSSVTVKGYGLDGVRRDDFILRGIVGQTIDIPGVNGQPAGALTFTALRPINVENLSDAGAAAPRKLGEHVAAVTGSAARDRSGEFRNVGPSLEYRLIDAAGQATDFHNYMLPITLDGYPVFLLGVRSSPAEPYRYLRIPADAQQGLDEFMMLRAALGDPEMRARAAREFAQRSYLRQGGVDGQPFSPQAAEAMQAVEASAQRALEVFASEGLPGITRFLESNVPGDELQRATEVIVRLLMGTMSDLRAVAREQGGLEPISLDDPARLEREDMWLRLAVAALSDLSLYPAPVFFMLSGFDQVEASVFQLTRSPGKNAVYLGCLLLALGVFAMFYIRERRVWVWLRRTGDDDGEALMAMTSPRRTLDFNREFERLRQQFEQLFSTRDRRSSPAKEESHASNLER